MFKKLAVFKYAYGQEGCAPLSCTRDTAAKKAFLQGAPEHLHVVYMPLVPEAQTFMGLIKTLQLQREIGTGEKSVTLTNSVPRKEGWRPRAPRKQSPRGREHTFRTAKGILQAYKQSLLKRESQTRICKPPSWRSGALC